MGVLITPTDFSNKFDVAAPGPIDIKINGTTLQADGAGVMGSPLSSLTYDAGTAVLTFTDNAGNAGTIDLSALTTDLFVTGGTFDANSSVLTLTDPDAGTADVTIDLSALLGVSGDIGNLLTNGADSKPNLQPATLCAAIKANCVSTPGTPCTDLAGNPLGYLIAV